MAGGAAPRSRPTVVVVDDAAEVRALVRTRLRLSGLLDVIGEAGNGAEAVDAVRRLHPALVLLDVSMPVMDGLEALPRILETSPETRVVMYSGFSEEGLAHRAVDLGASAFLEKSTDLERLAADLVAILEGGTPPVSPLRAEPPRAAYESIGEADRRVLQEHRERFREVFEDAAIGMATVTLAGQVVRANRSLGGILEREVDALVGTSYAELAGVAAPELDRLLGEILSGAEAVVTLEHDVPGADRRRVLATFAPVLDSARRPLYLFAQVQDVSGQREAEARLRASEARFQLLVDNVEDYAIFMLSTEGLIQSWNAGAQRIKGYTEDEIIGQHFRVFYPAGLQEARHPEHELELALRDGHYEEEGWRIRKDGSRFWANVLITTVRDADGRHVGFAKVTRDITERRVMQEERDAAAVALEGANARLQQAADDQAHFLAVTAHELRTPVGVLGGTADMLAAHWAELEDQEREELLAGMGASATRLRRLLNDLLTASRLQASRLELDVATVDVSAVVADCVATARRANPGVAIGLDVVADPRERLEVEGDAGRLGQVVDNLVANALGHGAPPVLVTVTSEPEAVVVEVSDAGAGVPEAVRARLFDRFSTGRTAGGTGLGLFIVRQLARAHGGDATYRPPSGEDRGAFVVRLRRRDTPAAYLSVGPGTP